MAVDPVTVYCWKGGGWAGFSQKIWKSPNYLGHEVVKKECDGIRSRTTPSLTLMLIDTVPCVFTFDMNSLPYADGVIMEGASFGANYEWRRKAPEFVEKRPWQQWVQLAYEQHHYFPMVLERDFMQRQDVNMTFVQHDQVPVTFLCSWGGGSIDDFLKPIKWPKRGRIAWINSNCGGGGAHARTNYVKELMKHIDVDALGPCLHNKDLPPEYTAHPFYGPQQFGGAMKFKHDGTRAE